MNPTNKELFQNIKGPYNVLVISQSDRTKIISHVEALLHSNRYLKLRDNWYEINFIRIGLLDSMENIEPVLVLVEDCPESVKESAKVKFPNTMFFIINFAAHINPMNVLLSIYQALVKFIIIEEDRSINVILVGVVGSGKTSIMNLLTGSREKTGTNLESITKEYSFRYNFLINQTKVWIIDTPGLFPSKMVDVDDPIVEIQKLLDNIVSRCNYLCWVTRDFRATEATDKTIEVMKKYFSGTHKDLILLISGCDIGSDLKKEDIANECMRDLNACGLEIKQSANICSRETTPSDDKDDVDETNKKRELSKGRMMNLFDKLTKDHQKGKPVFDDVNVRNGYMDLVWDTLYSKIMKFRNKK